MSKTRLSLFYLAGYLAFCGIGLLGAPQTAMRLFFATGQYSDLMLRMLGAMMMALFIIVVTIIVKCAEFMYPITLLVRAWLLGSLFVFYFVYRDPFLLVLIGVVGLGFVLTGWSYLSERRTFDRT